MIKILQKRNLIFRCLDLTYKSTVRVLCSYQTPCMSTTIHQRHSTWQGNLFTHFLHWYQAIIKRWICNDRCDSHKQYRLFIKLQCDPIKHDTDRRAVVKIVYRRPNFGATIDTKPIYTDTWMSSFGRIVRYWLNRKLSSWLGIFVTLKDLRRCLCW